MFIGKSSIYCMKEIEIGYTLSAYDIRSGKLLYDSSNPVLSKQQTIPGDHGSHIGFQVVLVNGGKELILLRRMVNVGHYQTILHIIDGDTGIRLHSAAYRRQWSCLLYPDPISTNVVVAFNLDPLLWVGTTTQNLMKVSIIQRFSYQEERAIQFSLVSTDVVLLPCNGSRPLGFSAFNPLSLAGVFCFGNYNIGIQGSAITPTRDKDFLATAAGVLRHTYPDHDRPPLNQCFVFGQGQSMTLPPRPEIGRHERTTVGLPEHPEVNYLQFADDGRMHLCCERDTYVFEF